MMENLKCDVSFAGNLARTRVNAGTTDLPFNCNSINGAPMHWLFSPGGADLRRAAAAL